MYLTIRFYMRVCLCCVYFGDPLIVAMLNTITYEKPNPRIAELPLPTQRAVRAILRWLPPSCVPCVCRSPWESSLKNSNGPTHIKRVGAKGAQRKRESEGERAWGKEYIQFSHRSHVARRVRIIKRAVIECWSAGGHVISVGKVFLLVVVGPPGKRRAPG